MRLEEIKDDQILPIGSKVIHITTLEIGIVTGECLGYGKCRVNYPNSDNFYPQPKRNIRLIVQ